MSGNKIMISKEKLNKLKKPAYKQERAQRHSNHKIKDEFNCVLMFLLVDS